MPAPEVPLTAHPPLPATQFPADEAYLGFRMGVQSYCFRNFKTLDDLAAKLKELNLAHVEIWPDGHLPVDTPLDQVKAAAEKIKALGMSVDACGVVGFDTNEAKARQIFEYGKALGVLAISGSPQPGSLQLVDKLANEYGLPVAIHNHGPEDPIFGSYEQVRTAMLQTSNMVGFCMDCGHFYRAGVDPMLALDEFSNRVYGIHLKDLVPDADGKWKDVIVGTGKINLVALLDKLDEIGFKGYLSLEYESDPDNPVPAMLQCLDNIKAAAAKIKAQA
ncbi:sugar phosphate isomerase/epimerase [bacterium]|nr:sugar phosphate isomerase/epimerase [bacterium]